MQHIKEDQIRIIRDEFVATLDKAIEPLTIQLNQIEMPDPKAIVELKNKEQEIAAQAKELNDPASEFRMRVQKRITEYRENAEVQEVLADLAAISETFTNLDSKDFQTIIEENKNKINECQREKEKENLRKLYINAVDDDTEALKIQMQLRDKINKRLNSEKIND